MIDFLAHDASNGVLLWLRRSHRQALERNHSVDLARPGLRLQGSTPEIKRRVVRPAVLVIRCTVVQLKKPCSGKNSLTMKARKNRIAWSEVPTN
jgi:hypothetical protein